MAKFIARKLFPMTLDNPGSGMGCLWLRTHANTAEDMEKLLLVLPAVKRFYEPDELGELMKDPTRRAEAVQTMRGYARLGGDLGEE